jgi:tetratricopeptide (TPR) repeat protein
MHEGEAQAFGAATSYAAWRPVWAGLFGLVAGTPMADQLAHLEHRLAEADPALVARAPLLGPLLGLGIPDNELTGQLDAKLRKASLEQMLATYLAFVARQPVAILLEDTHWLDPLSQDLLVMLGRAVAGLPVLLVLAHRDDGSAWCDTVRGWEHAVVLHLDALEDEAAVQMVRAKAQQLFGLADPPTSLVDLVLERSEGSPFHIEELLNFIRTRAIDPADGAALRALDVPESLHSLVLSRLDQLTEPPRRTVKVASVVGRLFHTPTLLGSYPSLGTSDEVTDHLGTLRAAELVLLESAAEQAHLFRHSVIRDVAYDSIPFALREELHERVGSYLEGELDADESGRQRLDLLAHHFGHSRNTAKKLEYLLRAGEAAQAVYNNAVAADYLRRALPLLAPEDRGPTARRLGQVLEILGEWPEAERTYAQALVDADAQGDVQGIGLARLALAEIARKQGRYDQAAELLSLTEAEFVEIGDEAGRGQALHLAGTLAAQQGRYDDARVRYLESLEIRRMLGDRAHEAALLGNLGILAEYEGDYGEARRLNGAALALRQELDDRWAIGASLLNVGMAAELQGDLSAARAAFTESMQIMTQIGDPWMTAVAHNNLGNTLRRLGELGASASHLADSLRAYRSFDDRWAIGILFEDVAALAVAAGQRREQALLLVGAADAVRSDLGSPRPPAVQAELEELLGEHDASAGRQLGLDAAIALALEICEQIV